MLDGIAPARVVLVVGAALTASACTLVRPYASLDDEDDPTECVNGVDDDGDGATDCEDRSCTRCVGAPRITCPTGWAARDLGGGYRTCDPPPRSPLDGCPEGAPPGEALVPAEPGALAAAIEAEPRDAVELWLAPGVHEAAIVTLPHSGRENVRLHGTCAAGLHPVLVPAAGAAIAISADSHLFLDHLELRVGEGAWPARNDIAWLDHVRVIATEEGAGDASLRSDGSGSPRAALELHGSEVTVPIRLNASRLLVEESSIRSVLASSAVVTMRRVSIDYLLPGIEIEGPLSVLDADEVFGSGHVHGYHASTLRLREVVLQHAFVSHAPAFVPGPEIPDPPQGSVYLEDVVIAGGPVEGEPHTGLNLKADHELARVAVLDTTDGAYLVGPAEDRDLIVERARRSTGVGLGIEIVCDVDLDRARVAGVAHTALVVRACEGARAPRLDRIVVEGQPGGCEGEDCAWPATGVAIASGAPALAGASIEDVDGCAIWVAADAAPTLLRAHVTRSLSALCTPTRDPAALGAAITTELVGTQARDDDRCACLDATCAACPR